MAKAKGSKKTGGRQRGTPNRKTQDLIDSLADLDFDAAKELVYCYREAVSLYKHKMKTQKGWGAGEALNTASNIAKEIATFIFPKKKAIAHTGADGGPITFAQMMSDLGGDEDDDDSDPE